MQCSEFEIRVCEYLDGTLDEQRRQELEQHASTCAACGALLADSRAVAAFVERVEPAEAPPELITNILYRTRHARATRWLTGWRGRLQPLLEPRFAMSMAMTILSVSMLYRVAGVQIRQLEVSDLSPVRVWQTVDNGAHRVWNRGVKFYQNVRFVYEIMEQWRVLQAEDEQAAAATAEGKSTDQPSQNGQPADRRKVEPSARPRERK